MALFDYVTCEAEIPTKQTSVFQTKSLDNPYLRHCVITNNGRLLVDGVDRNYEGLLIFYTGDQYSWLEYEAIFDMGQLVGITKTIDQRGGDQ